MHFLVTLDSLPCDSMENIPIGAHPSHAPSHVMFGDVDVEVQVSVYMCGMYAQHLLS